MADGKVVYEIRGDNSKFQSDVNQTENIAKSKTSAIGSFAKGAVVAVGAAVAAAGAGIVAFSKDAIGAGSQFDTAMSQVAATMGTTVDQIQDLSNFAMDMGATTAFSANEAADALNYMALAGYDAETSMKMLPNVLNLAAAGGIDLARASDMVTDAQSALGLSLDQTSEMVDKMAKASSKSNTSVEQLGDAFLTVGGTAKNLKGGTTELATVLGVLADNGIKGSEGGTALRNVILALSAPTDTAAKKLEELGVSAYDADGNMRALPDVFDDLNKSMEGMTQGEKTDVLNTIFNKVDLKSANALLATSQDRFNELSSAIDNASGAAQQMADTQLDNLNGDITLMKSALEGAKITLSNSLTPTLRKFVQFGTKEIGKLDKAFKNGGIEGFSSQLGKSLGGAVSKLTQYVPKFVEVAAKLAYNLVSTLLNSLTKNFSKLVRAGKSLAEKLANGLSTALPDLLGKVGELIGKVLAETPRLIKIGVDIAKGLIEGIIKGIPQFLSGVWDGLKGLFSTPLTEDAEVAIEKLNDLRDAMDEWRKEQEKLNEELTGVDQEYAGLEYWLGIFDDLKDKTNLTKTEQEKLNTAVGKLNEILPEAQKIIQNETGNWEGNTQAIKDNIEAMKARAKAEIYFEKMNDTLAEMVDKEIQLGDAEAELEKRRNALNDALEATNYKEFSNFYQDATRFADDVLRGSKSVDQASDALKEYARQNGFALESVEGLNAVIGYLQGEMGELDAQIQPLQESFDKQNDLVYELTRSWSEMNDVVDQYATKGAELEASAKEFEKAGADSVDGYIAGLNSKKAEVQAAAQGLSSAALTAMKRGLEIASPSKKIRKEVGQMAGKGLELGLTDEIDEAEKASKQLVDAIDLTPMLPDVPRGSLDISSENSEMRSILAVLNQMLPRIGQSIVLDTGELVGATVGKYDASLGQLQKRRARYE